MRLERDARYARSTAPKRRDFPVDGEHRVRGSAQVRRATGTFRVTPWGEAAGPSLAEAEQGRVGHGILDTTEFGFRAVQPCAAGHDGQSAGFQARLLGHPSA
jgi:hypothetical protein